VTVYNGRFRCNPYPTKKPVETIVYRGKVLGRCVSCRQWFRLYTNGNVVMHKRDSMVALLHVHTTEHRNYTHAHRRGSVPHGHHGSRYGGLAV
jgi:hypothetical protein